MMRSYFKPCLSLWLTTDSTLARTSQRLQETGCSVPARCFNATVGLAVCFTAKTTSLSCVPQQTFDPRIRLTIISLLPMFKNSQSPWQGVQDTSGCIFAALWLPAFPRQSYSAGLQVWG